MSELCAKLLWDSEFFGVPIARSNVDRLNEATADEIDRWAAAHRVACLYFVARADDKQTPRVAESHGYRFVDVRLTFERTLNKSSPQSDSSEVRTAVDADLEALERIAGSAHTDTRFYFDGNFPREACDQLYRTWIRNSLRGFADVVLVTGALGVSNGYITCHIDRSANEGSIGLIAVASSHRGKGIGKTLVNAAIDWLTARNLDTVSVVTQGRNIVAQRLYQQCGFVTRSIELCYHKWYTAGIEKWPPKPVQSPPPSR